MSNFKVDIAIGSDGSIAFDVPLQITKRGYRELVQLTGPEAAERPRDAQPTALYRTLSRAERWRRMLESGEHAHQRSGKEGRQRLQLRRLAAQPYDFVTTAGHRDFG